MADTRETAERRHACDRDDCPTLTMPAPSSPRYTDRSKAFADCEAHRVDWRARALEAEGNLEVAVANVDDLMGKLQEMRAERDELAKEIGDNDLDRAHELLSAAGISDGEIAEKVEDAIEAWEKETARADAAESRALPPAAWRREPPTVEEAKAYPFGWFNRNEKWRRYHPDGVFRFDLATSSDGDGYRYWFDEFPSEMWAEIGGEWLPCIPYDPPPEVVEAARSETDHAIEQAVQLLSDSRIAERTIGHIAACIERERGAPLLAEWVKGAGR